MITNKNKIKAVAEHISCDCKCKSNSTICNSNETIKHVNVNINNIVLAKNIIVKILAHEFARIVRQIL